ncbi:MAG: HAD family hydrolase [Firmicutes bacterium]|nr:HAD family hydrolase [Bacillota bacterium]
MYRTLLFDLDGTLLDLDMNIFLPIYFRALTKRFADIIDPEEFIHSLLASTEAMIGNKDPGVTNEEAFMADFVPRVPLSKEALLPLFMDFYQNDFADLSKHSRTKPLARKTIQCALDKGLEVVIATNPVFPRLAVEQRLKWADVAGFPYRLVTSYEIMHFCKPHSEYYAEILTRLGRRASECLMIGNDVQEDLSARDVGIETFLLKDQLINRTNEAPLTEFQGHMEDLYRFVQKL